MELCLLTAEDLFCISIHRVDKGRQPFDYGSELWIPIEELTLEDHRKEAMGIVQKLLHHRVLWIGDAKSIGHACCSTESRPRNQSLKFLWLLKQVEA